MQPSAVVRVFASAAAPGLEAWINLDTPNTWARVTSPRLTKRPMEESEAIQRLAEEYAPDRIELAYSADDLRGPDGKTRPPLDLVDHDQDLKVAQGDLGLVQAGGIVRILQVEPRRTGDLLR